MLERKLKVDEAAVLFGQAAQLEPPALQSTGPERKVVSDSSYMPGTSPQRAAELNKRALELKGKGIRANGVGCCCRGRWPLGQVPKNTLPPNWVERSGPVPEQRWHVTTGPCTGVYALTGSIVGLHSCLSRANMRVAPAAIEANPANAFGREACCVPRGRLAVVPDNRSKVQLARLAQVGRGRSGGARGHVRKQHPFNWHPSTHITLQNRHAYLHQQFAV